MLLVLMLGSRTLTVLGTSSPAAPAGSEPPQVLRSHRREVGRVSGDYSHV
jgi:hypothetical protein